MPVLGSCTTCDHGPAHHGPGGCALSWCGCGEYVPEHRDQLALVDVPAPGDAGPVVPAFDRDAHAQAVRLFEPAPRVMRGQLGFE